MTDEMDEFDNRFKDSAEKFSLIPSAGIWKNVEADIMNRERKRRLIIFLFLLAGILSSGIFLWNQYPSKTKTSWKQNNSTTSKQNAVPANALQELKKSTDNSIPSLHRLPDENLISDRNENRIKFKQSLSTVSSSTINKEIASAAQSISTQNNSVAINQQQTEIHSELTTAVSPVIIDSIKPSLSTDFFADSLMREIKTGAFHATKPETINQDTLPEMKDSVKTIPAKSNWSIAIAAAPARSYVKLDERGDYQFILNYRDSSDKTLLTLNYHLALHYKLFTETELFTGIGVINFEQEILSRQAVYKYDTNTLISGPAPLVTVIKNYFNINGDSSGTVKNKFVYLEIPVGLRYIFLPGHKFIISLQPEIAFNKRIYSEGYVYKNQTRTYEKIQSADLKPWIVSYGIGLSFGYEINRNVCIELTPYYKSFQKTIYETRFPISQRFQQTELRLSLRYLFK